MHLPATPCRPRALSPLHRPSAESLAARRPEEFDPHELHDRLESLEWISDAEFHAYGMDSAHITQLRRWAHEWMEDLALRLAEPYEEPSDH